MSDPKYLDFSMNHGPYNKAEEFTDSAAVILAVKNICLSRPGNYPFTPRLGLDIEKYLFELADEETLNALKTELMDQVNTYIPNVGNVVIDLRYVEDTTVQNRDGRIILGIGLSAIVNGKQVTANFLAYHDFDGQFIFNEAH